MLACLLSAACLYFPPLTELVGRRRLVVLVHEWSGVLLPVPLLLGLASPALRADLRRLNRLAPYDRRWLRGLLERLTGPRARPAGKFNLGQKVYAGWIAGAVLVMLATGLLMWFTHVLSAIPRASAIFIHDFLALAVVVVLVAHVRMALKDEEARRGMRTGEVDAAWAAHEHPHWIQEEENDASAQRVR
jgi:formate dehydrogenase subunit gamma